MTQDQNRPGKKQICLIAPIDLVAWLERRAEADRRSTSNQIVVLLEQARALENQ